MGGIVTTLLIEADLRALRTALQADGFALKALVEYTPQKMLAQIDSELPNARALTEFRQELKIVKAPRVLAETGVSFYGFVRWTTPGSNVLRTKSSAWVHRRPSAMVT